MTNIVVDGAMDALLDFIADNATELHLCSGNPTDRTTILANSLGSVAVAPADFATANGDISGRKHTLAQKQIASASASGTAHTVGLIDATTGHYRVVDLQADQGITVGNPVTIAAHAHEVRDPS